MPSWLDLRTYQYHHPTPNATSQHTPHHIPSSSHPLPSHPLITSTVGCGCCLFCYCCYSSCCSLLSALFCSSTSHSLSGTGTGSGGNPHPLCDKLYPFFHQSLCLSKILEKNLLNHCRDTCVYCYGTAAGMLIDGMAWRSAGPGLGDGIATAPRNGSSTASCSLLLRHRYHCLLMVTMFNYL